jgi:hypothetical protein
MSTAEVVLVLVHPRTPATGNGNANKAKGVTVPDRHATQIRVTCAALAPCQSHSSRATESVIDRRTTHLAGRADFRRTESATYTGGQDQITKPVPQAGDAGGVHGGGLAVTAHGGKGEARAACPAGYPVRWRWQPSGASGETPGTRHSAH